MDLWAHSANPAGIRHRLDDHLRGTARLAARFGTVFGAADVAAYTGLVHDVGKGACAWQEGLARAELAGGRVGVPHKDAGALLAARGGVSLLSAAVLGHHGGLPHARDVKDHVLAG